MKLSSRRSVIKSLEQVSLRLDNLAGVLSDYLDHEASVNAQTLATVQRIEAALTTPGVNGAVAKESR